MAITSVLPGVEVFVCINGQTATEYDDPSENPDPKTCIKYIECKDGAPFFVGYKVTSQDKWDPKGHFLQIKCQIDGQYAGYDLCYEFNGGTEEPEQGISETLAADYVFADIKRRKSLM
ncbi:hypothetical protein M426DRAFT_12525 [Hypoxylon sp. CI-4A]|nr:hypothetical protein M426DRAFT_12525 [Hypoxylon sp. CI-4A]